MCSVDSNNNATLFYASSNQTLTALTSIFQSLDPCVCDFVGAFRHANQSERKQRKITCEILGACRVLTQREIIVWLRSYKVPVGIRLNMIPAFSLHTCSAESINSLTTFHSVEITAKPAKLMYLYLVFAQMPHLQNPLRGIATLLFHAERWSIGALLH